MSEFNQKFILTFIKDKLTAISDAQVDELIETFNIEGKNKRDVLFDEFSKQLTGWLGEGQDDKIRTFCNQLDDGKLSIGVYVNVLRQLRTIIAFLNSKY